MICEAALLCVTFLILPASLLLYVIFHLKEYNMKPVIRTIAASAALVAAVALVPVSSQAYLGDDAAPPPAGKHFKKLAKELHLTAQQKQQVKELFEKNRPQVEPLIKQLAAERRALRALIQADAVDEAAIRAQSAKSAAIQADLAVHRAHAAHEFRAILTPEQIARARELQAERDRKLDERMSRPGKRSKQEP
jgi:protein CpxP